MPRPISAFLLGLLFSSSSAFAKPSVLFSDGFDVADGLITNEFAYWNPASSAAVKSANWEMSSGSLFAQGGAGWTGAPDAVEPNAASTNGNNSAVFRMTTRRGDFKDVDVSFSLFNVGLTTTSATPAQIWDGAHIWLRYQSQYHLYYASINRRDDTVVIKKKVPGGPSNGGTYYELCESSAHAVPYKTWQKVRALVKNNADNSVTISLFSDGILLAEAKDTGAVGGPPITAAGKVGLRADNANLKFDDFIVTEIPVETSAEPLSR